MTRTTDASCFPPCRPEATAPPTLDADAIQLFCLPHSGAGASAYRDWPELMAPGIEAIPVQLPGREGRFREPTLHSAAELVAGLREPVASRAKRDFALFGHSMGALLCYELAHELFALGKPPRHLFVSGLGAPHLPREGPLLHELPDDEVIAVVANLEGTPPELLAQPELVQLLLPLFRADLRVWETYIPHRGPLRVPVTAMGGRQDRSVSLDRVGAWGSLTSADFQVREFDGGHFYHHTSPGEVAAIIEERLREPSPMPATPNP
ncbi:MAG TPA: alpha/beta fold hydrolase [Actinophytocola sp.]|jgi:surfactin synthase thioesterase subunit|uniref:thioesterase II family protein n=1 Tax=Actinophytocola sp. TaxID=1872138 RepID=UPI002DF8E905|nr:alpha/beta fold hydrolase [Actinophytocola sp.]